MEPLETIERYWITEMDIIKKLNELIDRVNILVETFEAHNHSIWDASAPQTITTSTPKMSEND